MVSELLPQWRPSTPPPLQGRPFRLWSAFLRSRNGVLGTAIFSTVILVGLICHMTLFTPHVPLLLRPSAWNSISRRPNSPEHDEYLFSPTKFPSPPSSVVPHLSPSPSLASDELTLEQIRDIVAPTRGFYSRDYSIHLGWNNMRYILDAALLQAGMLNRTLVIPSFAYARACEYGLTVCADYATMVNKGDAMGRDEWRELPIEQQMGFRIPISVMMDLPRFRERGPVITASEYLRLHGQDPEVESTDGSWPRESYHNQGNVFESDRTKTPSLFVIENHWYDPPGTIRVDYIPQEMKGRENSQSGEGQTGISKLLWRKAGLGTAAVDWEPAKGILELSELGPGVDLGDDAVVERILNDNGWEVLHTFAHAGAELDRQVVTPIKQVAPRSSIRGFKDDYYHSDADVVVLAGEIHVMRKVGMMRFTTVPARVRFAISVVHYNVPPKPILELGEVLAGRMRELNDNRLWMGAHMRRGDFVREGWTMELTIEAHMQRVKSRLGTGRAILANLGNVTTYDIEGVEPNPGLTTLSPPLPNDRFYVATDERDSNAVEVIRKEGGVFLSDLLTIEDRRKYGWPLLLTDMRAVVEQSLLAYSAYFYGHLMSSFAGAIVNKRAGLGADRRTAVLD